MDAELIAGGVLAVLLLVYLVIALLQPERFG
ncbi:MAG TPA: K(+)-transporting ATPase subunit F [Candidatus Limnocylindria bacterium]|jgi:K+-transporting ATPase KdpF subunit